MFSIRKMKSAPIHKTQTSHNEILTKHLKKNTIFLEDPLDGMIAKYEHKDAPINTPSKPSRPPSDTPTIDKLLLTLLLN
jgi:hypothetical protein